MKKCLSMLAMAGLAVLCFTGCSKGPEDVAIKFSEAMAEVNIEKASKYANEDTQKLLKMFDTMADAEDKEKAKKEGEGTTFKAVETKIDGDKATVKIESTKDGKTETKDVDLVKVDGEWKVAVNKK